MVSKNIMYKRFNENLVVRSYQDEVIILNTAKELIFTLNSTGAFLWRKLAVKRSIEELSGLLAQNYSLKQSVALQDTLSFIKTLKTHSLLKSD